MQCHTYREGEGLDFDLSASLSAQDSSGLCEESYASLEDGPKERVLLIPLLLGPLKTSLPKAGENIYPLSVPGNGCAYRMPSV